jgi:hypothetical protein
MRSSLPRLIPLAGFVLVILVVLDPGILSAFLPAIWLIVGWIPSSSRLILASHAAPASILWLALAAAALFIGSHTFLQWLHGNLVQKSPQLCNESGLTHQTPWRCRWTVCIFGIMFASLVSVGCGILTIHQVFWLSRSSEPWFVNVTQNRVLTIRAAHDLQVKAQACNWSTIETQTAFWASQVDGNPVWEVIQPVWAEAEQGKLRAVVLIPRRLPLRDTIRFSILQPGTNVVTLKLEHLPRTLATFALGHLYPETIPTP